MPHASEPLIQPRLTPSHCDQNLSNGDIAPFVPILRDLGVFVFEWDSSPRPGQTTPARSSGACRNPSHRERVCQPDLPGLGSRLRLMIWVPACAGMSGGGDPRHIDPHGFRVFSCFSWPILSEGQLSKPLGFNPLVCWVDARVGLSSGTSAWRTNAKQTVGGVAVAP